MTVARLALFLLSLFLISSGPVLAQPEAAQPVPMSGEQLSTQLAEDPEVTVLRDEYSDDYVDGTVENYSKLYWRLRVFDKDDDTAIDNFMLINECQMYRDFFHDDFEWRDLREAARGMLTTSLETFPLKFKFMLPIKLDRYDPERGGFALVENTAFTNLRRVEISGNSMQKEICGINGEIKDYPRNIVIILAKPVTYDFLKVDGHVAQAFILREKYESQYIPEEKRVQRYEREAYLRLRMTFSQYQGNIKGSDSHLRAVVYGTLDGIDVFEDPQGKQLLTTVNFQ